MRMAGPKLRVSQQFSGVMLPMAKEPSAGKRVDRDGLRGHYLWLTKALMTRIAPEDLTTDTLISLVEILAPEHARLIVSMPPRRPALGGDSLRLVQ